MKKELGEYTITQVNLGLTRGDFSAQELAKHYLSVIEKENKEVHAYIDVYDDVEEQAKEADRRISAGDAGLLTGIPVALKDNILRVGHPATAGSKILEGYRATYSATVVEKLSREGVVFLGRTNLDEFAMGSSTENSAFGVTKNPHDLSRVAGGSSGGSAAVVSMGAALAALGSYTGGSIRQPASFCGVVGLKPTYGGVSRSGLVALGSSLDVIGPLGRTVSDVEIVFRAISGEDPLDSTTLPDNWRKKNEHKKRLIVGVPRHLLAEGLEGDVLSAFEESLTRLAKAGHELIDVELPAVKYALAVYYIILPAEASTNLARFDGVKYGLRREGASLLEDYLNSRGEGFGREPRRRIILGTYVLSSGYYDAYYGKALAVRRMMRKEFEEVFERVDAMALPTTPGPAFKIGERADPLSMYLEDIFTVPANLAGLPAISLPAGAVSREGVTLPLGFQLIAPSLREDVLFRLGREFLGESEETNL